MSISSLFSSVNASTSVSSLFAPTATTGIIPTTNSDGDNDGSSSTSISSKAKLFQQLQQLSQTNPAEFKKVTADIATTLQAQATKDGGQQGQALSAVANKFQQASQTGNLSSLEPKHHGGGHHHSGSSTAASSTTTDPLTVPTLTSTDSSTASSTTSGSSLLATALAAYGQSESAISGSQVDSIISQVLTQDLGSTATSVAA